MYTSKHHLAAHKQSWIHIYTHTNINAILSTQNSALTRVMAKGIPDVKDYSLANVCVTITLLTHHSQHLCVICMYVFVCV